LGVLEVALHTLPLLPLPGRGASLLCLGAHCDDIEIGCGGTLLELAAQRPDVRLYWVVFASDTVRGREARASAQRFGANVQIEVHTFRNGYFPYVGAAIKDCFENLKQRVHPDVVLTHRLEDRHQDHRTVAELTWNTFRDHLILEYEIAKYEGDLGQPGVYVPLEDVNVERKIAILMQEFASQRDKSWFSDSTFRGLMRLRGVECNAPSGYAEAFHCRKLVLAGR
jgi:LmbE family N-acetylglucosaminyl deacetylase